MGRKLRSGVAVVELVEVMMRELVEAADVGDAAFVTDDKDFSAALDGCAVFAAGGGGAAGSGLREDDFADAAVVADAVADVRDDARHLGVFRGEDALAWEEELEEDGPEKCCTGEAADGCQQQDHRREEGSVVIQQISCCAKPGNEGGDGESIDR